MNLEYLVFLLLAFERSFAFKPDHQIVQPTKSIFSNKKCKETVTPARYVIGNKNAFSDQSITCDENIGLAQYFPDMDCPASILEASRPFFYKTCEASAMLGPFSDDVKLSYSYLLEKNKKALEEVRAKYMNDFTPCPISYFKNKTVSPTICSSIPEEVEVFNTTCELMAHDKESLCKVPVEKESSNSLSESEETIDDEVAEGLCLVDLCPEVSACEIIEENDVEDEITKEIEEVVEELVPEIVEESEAIKECIKKLTINEEEIAESPCQYLDCEPSITCSEEIIEQESSECDELTPLLETLLICEDILDEYDCSTLLDDLDEEEEVKEIVETMDEGPKEELIMIVSDVCEPGTLLNNVCRVFSLPIRTPNKISNCKCNKPTPKLDKSLLEKLKSSRYYNACPNKELFKSCPKKRNVGK